MNTDNAAPAVPPGMTSGDMSLLTGPYVPLTEARIEALKAGIAAHEDRYQNDFPKLVDACDYETKLAVACWVMKHVYAHAKEGGTYRYLIYHRLGFGPDSYAPMMFADALNISNEFTLPSEGSESDQRIAQLLHDLFIDMPVSDKRSQLVDAFLRFEELAAFARAACKIIDKQRMELSQFNERATG